MGMYVEVNGTKYPAIITNNLIDNDWNGRASKAIKTRMSYAKVVDTFVDGVKWSIVEDVEDIIEHINEETVAVSYEYPIRQETTDNSDYSMAGDIIDHRNGYITVKMGKPKAEEILAMFEEVM